MVALGLVTGLGPDQPASMNEAEVMEILGADGIRRIVAAFYRRVREDDVIGPLYPADDWEGSEERLREFLLFRLGGSTRYLELRGHPRLRMRHAPFPIGERERDRWLRLMDAAMTEAIVPERVRSGFLEPFFAQVADFLRNRPES
jgi:hemoglobin